MITKINKRNKKQYYWITEFLANNSSYDFYYTENNSRNYITDEKSVKGLFKNSEYIYYKEENGECVGIILVWIGEGGGKKRFYVKVNALSPKIAKDLLTVILWNSKLDLFVKIRKDSKFLQIFKEKRFKFIRGRGYQILLKRRYKNGS